MSDQSVLSELLLHIYDTGLKPSLWPDSLERVAHFIGARGAFIFELKQKGSQRKVIAPYFSKSYDVAVVENYLKQHNDQEVLDQEVFARHSRTADKIELVGDTVLAKNDAELLSRANVQAMMDYGLRYRAGALLDKDQLYRDRFAVQFSRSQGPISAEHLFRADLVLPHVAKALNVNRPTAQLAAKYSVVANALDRLMIGVCVLDDRGHVAISNGEFRRQLDWKTVFRLDASGRLTFQSNAAQRDFIRLRQDVTQHGQFGARPRKEAIITQIEGQPHTVCVEVIPLNNAADIGEPGLRGHIVYSMDARKSYVIDGDLLRDMFSLTNAELSVLMLVADGLTNPQISDKRNKSIETINSQVKAILVKTNTSNRTQLVRLATNISSSFVTGAFHPTG